jgi:hypothetical protein
MKTITKKKWDKTHGDYKLIDEKGQHKINKKEVLI